MTNNDVGYAARLLSEVVQKARGVLAEYMEHGKNADETVKKLTAILDGPEQRSALTILRTSGDLH